MKATDMFDLLNEDCSKDCQDERNRSIQNRLKKIKPLSKYERTEDVPFYMIEKTVMVLSKKYNMRIKELTMDIWANDDEVIWRATVIDDRNFNQVGVVLNVIYGLSIYEVFAKTAIYMYYMRENVGKRQVGISCE